MEEINIKDFFSYLKKYIFAFIVVVALAVGGVVVYDIMFKKPIYQAQTTVVIAKADSSEGAAAILSDVNASQKLASTYSEIAKSELVLSQVIENLGLHMDVKGLSKSLTIKPVDDTSILKIAAKNQNARLSAAIANEIATVFKEEATRIFKTENITQLSVAVEPNAPSNNTLVRDVVLAAVIGVLGVAGFAFLRFYLDDTVKYSEEIDKKIGMPVTGRITKGDFKVKKTGDELVVMKLPKSIVSENIKSLRTNLQFTSVDGELKTILVTSTNASEGKSFISANLAVSFAQADKKVLLVDCDLRKGRIHKIFNTSNTNGLSNLLTSELVSFRKFIRATKIKNLDIMTSGTYPPNPSELLASNKNKRLIDILSDHYDVIIFDGAPVGGLTDSAILSSLMDETVIVVKEANTTRADLANAKESLDKVGARIAGVVFNMVDRKTSKYYSNYYYGSTE